MRKWLLVLVMAALGLPVVSFAQTVAPVAQEANAEELLFVEIPTVDVASKRTEKISDAPGVISVITEKEIQAFGANTLREVVDRAASVFITSSYLWRDAVTSMRGDSETHTDNHVLILVNGRPVRESQGGSWNQPIYNAYPVDHYCPDVVRSIWYN